MWSEAVEWAAEVVPKSGEAATTHPVIKHKHFLQSRGLWEAKIGGKLRQRHVSHVITVDGLELLQHLFHLVKADPARKRKELCGNRWDRFWYSIPEQRQWNRLKTHSHITKERSSCVATSGNNKGDFYWAIQQRWFARLNAIHNLSCKKSRKVVAATSGPISE